MPSALQNWSLVEVPGSSPRGAAQGRPFGPGSSVPAHRAGATGKQKPAEQNPQEGQSPLLSAANHGQPI